MPILKALKRIFSPKEEEEVVIKVDGTKCAHHHCIDRRDYHVTCVPKCGEKRHLRDVTVCCECGQENYSKPYYDADSLSCGIVDDNWKKRDSQGSKLDWSR